MTTYVTQKIKMLYGNLCVICDCANYSQTTFDAFGIQQTANASALLDDSESEPFSFSPIHASSPTRTDRQNKRLNRPLRIVNNCQSITKKVPALQNFLLSTKPDSLRYGNLVR